MSKGYTLFHYQYICNVLAEWLDSVHAGTETFVILDTLIDVFSFFYRAINYVRCEVLKVAYTRFRLVPKSRPWMTLNGHYALFQNTCVFGAHKNLKEDAYYQRRRCSPMTPSFLEVYGLYGYSRVGRGVKRQWGCREQQFSVRSSLFRHNL